MQHDRHNDNKLLFAIAGGTVGMAALIAILASLGSGGSDDQARPKLVPTAAVRTATVESAALPVTRVLEPSMSSSTEFDTPADVERVQIDLSANLIQSGLSAYDEKRFTEAALYFAAEAEARPDRGWTHYILALSEWKDGQLEAAVVSMRRSIELEPQVRAFANLARIEIDRGEFDAALEASQAAVSAAPDDGEAKFVEARVHYNLGDRESALRLLEQSIELDSDNGFAHNLAGLIWIERGEAVYALEALEQAVARIPNIAYVQNNYGMALELNGQLDEAAIAYSSAAELRPGYLKASQNLARLDDRVSTLPEEATVTANGGEEFAALTLTEDSKIPD
jgi:tetratricopeptide (TPR) repeat protein